MNFKHFLFITASCILLTGLGETRAQFQEQVPEGYFTNPVPTQFGIVATNDFESAIYLINNSIEILVEAPGCGRFMNISKDGSLIGFKFIDEEGKQSPAVYNLNERKLELLHDAVENCGQVSFSDNGKIAFMIGNEIIVMNGDKKDKYGLGVFSNNAEISHDGSRVVFKDDDDQLWIYELVNGSKKKISDDLNGYYNAQWSLDDKNILFESIDAKVFTYNVSNNTTHFISKGENPKWSEDSRMIAFHKKEIDFEKESLINSDIFVYHLASKSLEQITNTEDVFEMDPAFDNKSIIYQTYINQCCPK